MDIGQLGVITLLGAMTGSPLSGWALDRYGPWVPIGVSAAACSWGCLWRGMASSLSSLRMGTVLLGIGVNLQSTVLGHLVKSFPSSMRSEVLSGFAVQIATLQLCGKGLFPLVEYMLHYGLEVKDTLMRYRIHMGTCTMFCFYGTFALFFDRKNVIGGDDASVGGRLSRQKEYKQKQSDVVDDLEEGSAHQEIELADRFLDDNTTALQPLSMTDEEEPAHRALNKQQLEKQSQPLLQSTNTTNEVNASTSLERSNHETIKTRVTAAILALALLLQSLSTTILTVLWPLLAHDRFNLSAQTFGVMTFASSVVSTGAVAAFPVVERIEKIGGRVRCAAWGFGIGAVLCLVFCACSFGSGWDVDDLIVANNRILQVRAHEGGTGLLCHRRRQTEYFLLDNTTFGNVSTEFNFESVMDGNATILDASIMVRETSEVNEQLDADSTKSTQKETKQSSHSWKQILLHALSAMIFQACLCFLEPSLKSILSLVVTSPANGSSSKSSLGFTMGFMTTIGNIGGMIGNIAGTWMYKYSKDVSNASILRGGALPFLATAFLLAISSMLIWGLDEPRHNHDDADDCNDSTTHSVSPGNVGRQEIDSDSLEESEQETRDGCCLALRETKYDVKSD